MPVAPVVHEGINLSIAHAELYCMKCLCNGLKGCAGRELTHGLLFTWLWSRYCRRDSKPLSILLLTFQSWRHLRCAYRKAIHVVAAGKCPIKIINISNMVFLPSMDMKELRVSARFRRRYGKDESSSKLSQSATVYSPESRSRWIDCMSHLYGTEIVCKMPFMLKLQSYKTRNAFKFLPYQG